MMPAGTYLLFRNKIDPIIRACGVPAAEAGRIPEGDLAVYRGQTTFTQGQTFYFSKSRAQAHQKQLLAICRSLPKMNAALPGSACTITSLELVRAGSKQTALKAQMEAAEQFFALLTLAGISAFRAVLSKTGIIYLNADIMLDFKDRVLSGPFS